MIDGPHFICHCLGKPMTCIPKFNCILLAFQVTISLKYFKRFDKLCNKFFFNCNAPGLIHINYKGQSTSVGEVFTISYYIIMHLVSAISPTGAYPQTELHPGTPLKADSVMHSLPSTLSQQYCQMKHPCYTCKHVIDMENNFN